jgi:exodeoxyribonuclease V alpha subunit
VVKILALLQEQALADGGSPLRILLLAPTGKAAQRLASSVSAGLASLDVPRAVRDVIPTEASTLHRALGYSKTAHRFRHDAESPLVADVVLIDEVSMVDLSLLYHVARAIRPDARLILQGDKDQLASVEAGAILGDIYNSRAASSWSPAFAEQVLAITGDALAASEQASPLADCLVHLTQSFRYDDQSGIGRLARAINTGDAPAALRVLAASSPEARDCQWLEPAANADGREEGTLAEIATLGYAPFIQTLDPAEKLARLGAYRILCAHRQGRGGVAHMNHLVETWLEAKGLLYKDGTFYENRPIIVTQNDYALGLFNGDVGVVIKDAAGRLRACFESSEGLRFIAPGRLPPHETVFATTIHKSQGSEFDAVSVILPEAPSPLLGRELLYTAVTRARRRVDVLARSDVLEQAISRVVRRASGLGHRLWG